MSEDKAVLDAANAQRIGLEPSGAHWCVVNEISRLNNPRIRQKESFRPLSPAAAAEESKIKPRSQPCRPQTVSCMQGLAMGN